MLKYVKGIIVSFLCMLFFWFFQYLGALLVLLGTGHNFIPFRIFSTINPNIKITDAIANRVGVLTLLGDLFVIIIALLIIKFIMRKNIVKTLRVKKFELKKLKVLIPATLGSLMVAVIVNGIIVSIFFRHNVESNMVSDIFKHMTSPLSVIGIVIVAPIAEELVFRGILFNFLRKRMKLPYAIIISSIAFGIFHQNISQGIFAASLGVILALMYVYTDSLFGDILTHMLVNATSTCLSLFIINGNMQNKYIQLVSGIIVAIYLFIGPVLILKAIKIYRREKGLEPRNFKVITSILVTIFILFALMISVGSLSGKNKINNNKANNKIVYINTKAQGY